MGFSSILDKCSERFYNKNDNFKSIPLNVIKKTYSSTTIEKSWLYFYKANEGYDGFGNIGVMPCGYEDNESVNPSRDMFFNMHMCMQLNGINKKKCFERIIKRHNSLEDCFLKNKNCFKHATVIKYDDRIVYQKNYSQNISYDTHTYVDISNDVFRSNIRKKNYPHGYNRSFKYTYSNSAQIDFYKKQHLKEIFILYNEINKCNPLDNQTCRPCYYDSVLYNHGIDKKTLIAIDNALMYSTLDVLNDVKNGFKECLKVGVSDNEQRELCFERLFEEVTQEQHNVILITDKNIDKRTFNIGGHNESFVACVN